MNSIKVAIVGYGLSGRVFHANLLTSMPEFQIRGVMTNDPIKQKDVICRHAGALIYTQFEEVLADDLVELVIISAPNTMHYKMASEALLKENICPSDIDQWGEDAVDNWGILNTINDSGNTYKTLNGNYRAYYQKLYRSIRFKEPVPVSSSCAVQTMQLIECAIQSHREKRRIHVTSIV